MNMLTLKIPELLSEKLNVYAKEKGVSKSEIVREALLEYFSSEGVVKSGAFYDMAKDLAGTVNEAPDLSTNKKHLDDGYGQ
jgi:hypothetical protein